MIASLRGTVVHVADDALVIDVGGVGYSVSATPALTRVVSQGSEVFVHTMMIVREDSMSLFGFESRDELAAFSLLLGVSGVGPKSALGVLSHLTVPQIAQAIDADDDAAFRRVSGIGPKTAKLIVVQLAGKLVATASAAGQNLQPKTDISAQVIAALVGLGWSERVADEAVARVVSSGSAPTSATVSSLLRTTLAELGPARKEMGDG
ncbi:Holliday junction DNA helicase RuvA [Microbacterium endophyticum]|uniref:Holliday junction branch migration complex subunit RuvA n=1 Tax=Microbacterium endophyticum TaxID=1526412 RepID=A0A7W4YN00_9MICO|nr:Holliday junction branch migration protein RuvA [Microbacterium endophyticum]MBB2977005.1 Holliday junction DNA helicase RuvA [Microbacterium endophyticum]NIK36709.1 Holliday junction DNA helicase RuvA [Microbacterium endophyticum]